MSIIIPANSAVGGGFEVANGVRMNRGSSDYFRRTNNTAGTSDKIGTYSGWVKRSTTTLDGMFFEGKDLAANNYTQIYFQATGALTIYGSTGPMDIVTTALFRDPSAWYHVVVAFDTTQGTATNRVKVYVNGVQFTSVTNGNGNAAQYPAENSTIYFGINGDQQGIGVREDGALLWNGYMSEICYVDGQALAPTEFGEFDEDSGVWKPIDVSGLTFGNNGCYLDFQDASNLGNVVAGNSTDFTENGLTSLDQTTDTCTNNFATLNVLANVIAPVTLTEGNLKIAMTNSKGGNLSTISCTDGKYYAEMKITTAPQDFRFHWGIMPYPVIAADDPTSAANAGIMLSGYNAVIYAANGIINSFYGNATGRFSGTPILGLAIDLKSATRTMAISINGAWVTGSNATDTDFSNALKVDITSYVASYPNWFIGCGSGNGSGTTGVYELNFGNPIFTGTDQADGNGYGSFEYPPPSGYLALCTKNLSGELS